MTSPYITEAVRRCGLPIYVSPVGDGWFVHYRMPDGSGDGKFISSSLVAAFSVNAVVKKITEVLP